jgi:4-amino-4-deoxy-L-arabinose transferase-like glycosyltransferase
MKTDFRKELGWLIVISLLVRTWLAWQLELGNDEVYYWTYALYPDWSHYDHPPMLGWVMQLFSLNLLFDSELALRLSSVLFFSLNTLLIFTAGKIIRDARTGWYAALLYNASVYASVITAFPTCWVLR